MVFDFRHKNIEGQWKSSGHRKGDTRDAAFAALEAKVGPLPPASTCPGRATAGPRTGTCSPALRRLAELGGQQLVGAAASLVVVGDRDHDRLLGAVGGGDLLDVGADLRRRAGEAAALAA